MHVKHTNTLACVSVTDAACALRVSDVWQYTGGSALTPWHRSHSCHTQCCSNTTVWVRVCVCERRYAGDVGFHHLRNTTKVYIPVNSSSGSLVHLHSPCIHNISTTLYIYRTHTSTFFFSLVFWKIIIIQVFAGQFASSDPCLWANWKAPLVVLHTFGQLRPCFPQGEQSPASSRCTPSLRFSPLCTANVCAYSMWVMLLEAFAKLFSA